MVPDHDHHDGDQLSPPDLFAGVDWGGSFHQLCVLDSGGTRLVQRRIVHDVDGLESLAVQLAGFGVEVLVAIERAEGLLVEFLQTLPKVTLFCVSPKISARARERYRLSASTPPGQRAWTYGWKRGELVEYNLGTGQGQPFLAQRRGRLQTHHHRPVRIHRHRGGTGRSRCGRSSNATRSGPSERRGLAARGTCLGGGPGRRRRWWRRPRRRQGQALTGRLRPALTPAAGATWAAVPEPQGVSR
jgi:hypothetical protein